MPFGFFSFYRLHVMDDGDQPVTIAPDVENHELAHGVGVLENGLHLFGIMPVRPLDDGLPRFDLVRRVFVLSRRLLKVLLGDDVHPLIVLHEV